MKKILLILTCFSLSFSVTLQDERTKYFPKATEIVQQVPAKKDIWVFIMAGQSNMAGRGQVEPQDTLVNKRVLTINAAGQLVYAKEPFHFYEPTRAGLDCGYAFANRLLKQIPANISVLMIPTAIGGSSVSQWIGDSVYRGVKLFSNFREKIAWAKQYGDIKAVLWHQGESDANKRSIPLYHDRLQTLFTAFRNTAGDEQLPVLIGELGAYSNDPESWQAINRVIQGYPSTDKRTTVTSTSDLAHKGDTVHFNTEGQRLMGERFAEAYLKKFK